MANNNYSDKDDSLMLLEMDLLLEALYRQFGYDFRNYNKAHIKRRLSFRMQQLGLKSFSQLQHKILYDNNTMA
jgi:chemotaxis protein methyltransferase CheR